MVSKSSINFEQCPEISTPASAITRTALGSRPLRSMPAERTSIALPCRCRTQPSAIWLRHELPVHRNNMRSFLADDVMALSGSASGAVSQRATGVRAEKGRARESRIVAHPPEWGSCIPLYSTSDRPTEKHETPPAAACGYLLRTPYGRRGQRHESVPETHMGMGESSDGHGLGHPFR